MKGIAHYCYAELPPLHMYDAKGMMVERMRLGLRTLGTFMRHFRT